MPEISQETRKRVLQVAEQLGYRPKPIRHGPFPTQDAIRRLIVGSFRNPYYAQLADAFVSELRGRDWQVVVGTADQDEARAIGTLASQTDAIIGYFLQPQEAVARAARGCRSSFWSSEPPSPACTPWSSTSRQASSTWWLRSEPAAPAASP
jgi:LacI family transcriptional regulator